MPHILIDFLIDSCNLKNDAQLGRILGIKAPHLSRIRNGQLSSSPAFILAIHEKLNIPVSQIRSLIALQK